MNAIEIQEKIEQIARDNNVTLPVYVPFKTVQICLCFDGVDLTWEKIGFEAVTEVIAEKDRIAVLREMIELLAWNPNSDEEFPSAPKINSYLQR